MIIYIITNKINKKQYIGQTTISIEYRWKGHCKIISSETRKKISESQIGRVQTEEHKRKNSEAIKSWWAKRKQFNAGVSHS
jgi:hypothetical protein